MAQRGNRRNLIRENKVAQMRAAMEMGRKDDMQTLDFRKLFSTVVARRVIVADK